VPLPRPLRRPGGPSAAVNVHHGGGSLEVSALLCAVSTPAALLTFPFAYRHFLLLLLDLPEAATHEAFALRAALLGEEAAALPLGPGPDGARRRVPDAALAPVPAAVLAGLRHHALWAAVLPMAAGAGLGCGALPAPLAAAGRRLGPLVAASMILATVRGRADGGRTPHHAHSGDQQRVPHSCFPCGRPPSPASSACPRRPRARASWRRPARRP
jgi:hypothetical protein